MNKDVVNNKDAGVTMIEACVAMLVLSTAALGAGQLFAVTGAALSSARLQISATTLAVQKVEQLRALAWRFEGAGALARVSDLVSDLSRDPIGGGGPGLTISAGSLSSNTPGYVDFVDRHGRWVGTGPAPPQSAVFIRRWSVTPLPANQADALVLRVLVTTVVRESQAAGGPVRRRLPGDALILTVVTRKAA